MTDRPKKRIILCSDGTGNTVVKNRGTNVWKTYESIDVNGHREEPQAPGEPRKTEQIAFYDDGVGTQNVKILKILGGAFGWGLSRNVCQLYTMLCRVYQPGDDIYLFGFSRGAHTARTVAGLITRCGVINDSDGTERLTDKELNELVTEAYKRFRKHFRLSPRDIDDKTQKFHAAERATDDFRRKYGHNDPQLAPDGKVPVRFVGVWDTVAAVGLPFKELTMFWNRFIYPFKFPTTELSPLVAKGCHAISIDDERETFHPDLWHESVQDRQSNRIEQIWFAGVHSNVGGGYPKQGVSLVALDWMMTKAEEQELRFLESERRKYRDLKNVHDKKYDPRSGLAIYYRYKPRDIAEICDKNEVRPRIHASALERIAFATESYAPGNLPKKFQLVTDAGEPQPGSRDFALKVLFEGATEDEKKSMIGEHFEEVKRWVRLRRGLHVGLLVLTIMIVIGGLIAFQNNADWWVYVILVISVVLLLGAVYFVGRHARRKLELTFSNWWRKALTLTS